MLLLLDRFEDGDRIERRLRYHRGMSGEEAIQTMVRLIYEAALDPASWNLFLERFSLAVNGSSTGLLVHDFNHSSANVAGTYGVDPYWQRLYAEHYGGTNTWLKNAPQMLAPGLVMQSQQAVADADLEKTEFYNDYLHPQNLFYSFGGTFGKEGAVVSYLTALRSRQAGAFGEAEMAVVRYLMPHLDCALRVHSRVSHLEERLAASSSALDHFPWAVVLIDSHGRPVLLNRAAQRIFEQNDGLSCTSAGVEASAPDVTEALRETGTLAVPRPSCRRPYEVLIVPLPVHTPFAQAPSAVAAMFISDPEDDRPADSAILRKLYGLTGAEARMAAALLEGKTTEAAAEEFEISINTARSQLRSILSKTQTNRQTDLVRLLMNSPARLRNGE